MGITKSSELTAPVIEDAARSMSSLRSLVTRISEIARPEEGWARLLKVLARVAGQEWLEGELQVDFIGQPDNSTSLELYAVLGVGIRERLFSASRLDVPIDEFQRAVVLSPELIAPLQAHQGRERLTLTTGMRVRSRDIPDFELEEKAKGDGERITERPPADVFTSPTKPPSS